MDAAPTSFTESGGVFRMAQGAALDLDCGDSLGGLEIAYKTYGVLNAARSNAVLVCHALTLDQHVASPQPNTGKPGWWGTLVGPGRPLDPARHFIICANVVGGCSGSTGPGSISPATGEPYGLRFPIITIGDMVRAQALLVSALGVMSAPLLEVRGLRKEFPLPRAGWFAARPQRVAVDGVDLTVEAGRSFGIVGESGSGKSTLARMVMALVAPSAGEVRLMGRSLFALSRAELKAARADFQMVFQDPYGSLDPRMTVARIVAEPLPGSLSRAQQSARVAQGLEAVGLSADAADKYPHEFSGGQRQRIAIARALATRPKLVVADEPVSALDVSVQAQVLNLMTDLQRDAGVTYLLISHDLAVRRTCLRRDRGDVSRPLRRNRPGRPHLERPDTSLHARTHRRRSALRGGGPEGARAAAVPGGDNRLPLRAALPSRASALPGGSAGADAARGWTAGGLPRAIVGERSARARPRSRAPAVSSCRKSSRRASHRGV